MLKGIKGLILFCMIVVFYSIPCYAYGNIEEIQNEDVRFYLQNIKNLKKIYSVKQDGTGDFTSIQEGIDAVMNNDVLIIYPGIYNENVIIKDKTVNLIGTSFRDCILTANAKNYYSIPLTFGAGLVANMTIYGYNSGKNDTVYYEMQRHEDVMVQKANEFMGYSIHIDTDYSTNQDLLIEDCTILSDTSFCIGIGTRPGNKILIENCSFICEKGMGGIFYHNSKYSGESLLKVSNSSFYLNMPDQAFAMQSVSEENKVMMQFDDVKVYDLQKEEHILDQIEVFEETNIFDENKSASDENNVQIEDEMTWNGLKAFQLNPLSKNNSIATMNG